jgi:hypothetical protein
MFRLWPHMQEDLVWRPSPIPNGPLNERRIANRFKAYLYTDISREFSRENKN